MVKFIGTDYVNGATSSYQATIPMGQMEMLRFLHDNAPNSVP